MKNKKIFLFLILVALLFGCLILDNSKTIDAHTNETNDLFIGDSSHNTTTSYYNDNALYQDIYSTYYYNNLINNFGNNIKGSCTYVALAMLLSFYDTYWNDSIIPENYDMISMLSANELDTEVESPGIYTESSSLVYPTMSDSAYYQIVEQYSSSHFHLKLIQIGKEQFGHYAFDTEEAACGLTRSELIELMNYYLYDYMGFENDEISFSTANTNVRNFVVENVKLGKPVLVRMGSSTSGSGHAFIIYDYNETSDELYGHMGWISSIYDYEHIKISTTEYDDYWDATVLNINLSHNCTNNYKYSNAYNTTATHCPCEFNFHPSHSHIYSNSYAWKNTTYHSAFCICGNFQLQRHAVISGSTTCVKCNGKADTGFIGNNALSYQKFMVSKNGSYVCPNGVIVLVKEDLENYLNDSLVFFARTTLDSTVHLS